jgi:hypothetical protein
VHIHRLARNLGFTRRRDLSWRTTEEITRALAAFDPRDPAGYDFSLCHMGMLQGCPSQRDPRRCEGCGVQPVCIHWVGRSGARKQEVGRTGARKHDVEPTPVRKRVTASRKANASAKVAEPAE